MQSLTNPESFDDVGTDVPQVIPSNGREKGISKNTGLWILGEKGYTGEKGDKGEKGTAGLVSLMGFTMWMLTFHTKSLTPSFSFLFTLHYIILQFPDPS